jgi:hypothetical protein
MLTEEEKKAKRREYERKYKAANREKINARKRERYANDPAYREKKKQQSAAWQKTKATGYGRGRPRKEEQRPVSILAEYAKRYRKDNVSWTEYNRTKQAEWVEKNPERRKEIVHSYLERRKQRQTQEKQ